MEPNDAIVGAGYVGVPLAQVFAEAGHRVVLLDVNAARVAQLNRGESYIEDVPSDVLGGLVESGNLSASTDYDVLRGVEAILIAVPTPLSKQREPDLSIVESAVGQIAERLQKGQLVVLESTTWPGTTRERVQPLLEGGSGLKDSQDFHLGSSPVLVDSGGEDWATKTTPKVVGVIDDASAERAASLYKTAIHEKLDVSS